MTPVDESNLFEVTGKTLTDMINHFYQIGFSAKSACKAPAGSPGMNESTTFWEWWSVNFPTRQQKCLLTDLFFKCHVDLEESLENEVMMFCRIGWDDFTVRAKRGEFN